MPAATTLIHARRSDPTRPRVRHPAWSTRPRTQPAPAPPRGPVRVAVGHPGTEAKTGYPPGPASASMSSTDTELAALDTIVRTLNSLEREQLSRVLSYIRSRYTPVLGTEESNLNGRSKQQVPPPVRPRNGNIEGIVTRSNGDGLVTRSNGDSLVTRSNGDSIVTSI